jgi:two-component system, OmpR family, phosphate regulon response regulator OmpR
MPTYVLLLEDHEGVAELLCDAFREAGYRCFVLRKKATAERFLHRVRPDLIIVDYSLVGGNGLQAAQMAAEAKVPVIVTSGHHEVREEVEIFGFTFLPKPFRIADMLALAARLLGDPAA